MNEKQNNIFYKDNKDKLKNNLINDYGYNFNYKKTALDNYNKVYHFKNKTKIK